MKLKKLFILLSTFLIVPIIPFSFGESSDTNINEANAITKRDINEYEVKTLSDYNTVVTKGDSYYDEGILYYRNNNNILHYDGYKLSDEDLNCLTEFYVYFDQYDDPTAYFSVEFRASDVGSVLADISYVYQNGYCFVFNQNGVWQIYKDHNATPLAYLINGPHFTTGSRLFFKCGVLEENNYARLVVYVDNVLIYDEYDTVNPIISGGNYMNFCSWINYSAIASRIVPTKEKAPIEYKTFTLSNLNKFPTRSGDVIFEDNYNNLRYHTSSDTAGFDINEQNYSIEMRYKFESFNTAGVALYVALRATTYARANGLTGGYDFGLGNGTLYISKPGVKNLGTFYFTPIEVDGVTEHIVEFGAVDVDESTTYLFVKLDGKLLGTVYDGDNPRQHRGMFIMSNEGLIIFDVSSCSSYVKPLKTKVSEEDNYMVYKTYFQNSVDFAEGSSYEDMPINNLKSIYINEYNLIEFNDLYYGKELTDRAADVSFKSNIITIKIAKNMHKKLDNSEYQFTLDRFKLQKQTQDGGLVFNTGYKLKNSYFYFPN